MNVTELTIYYCYSGQVGYLLHNTSYRHNETFLSNREIQFITMMTAGLYNTQEIRLSVNKSAINENNPPKLSIEWGGRISQPISVLSINAISGTYANMLLWLQCIS